MKIKVGQFVLSTEEKYSTLKEAKEMFMKHFPTAVEADVEKAVKPLVKKNDNVTSAKQKSAKSTERSSETDTPAVKES